MSSEALNKLAKQVDAEINSSAPKPADDRTAALQSKLRDALINPDEDILPDEFLFSWQGVSFMPKDNIISLKAPAKSGKTFGLTLFLQAFLTGNLQGLKSEAGRGDKVLFFDTEQSRNDTRKILRRVRNAAPGEMDRIQVYNLEALESAERLPAIELQIDEAEPALVIIDGIIDLVPGMDYNDGVAAESVISTLKRIASRYNAVIMVAIHTNNRDDFATGWLGRILKQKCALEMIVERKAKSTVRELRFSAVRHREFSPLSFDIRDTDDGLGEAVILTPENAEKLKRDAKRAEYTDKLLALGFEPFTTEDRAWLHNEVRKRKTQIEAKECSKQSASNFISRCIEHGAIKVHGDRLLFET